MGGPQDPIDHEALRAALAGRARVRVPDITETKKPADANGAATQEAEALALGTLEDQSKANETARTERFRDHVAVAILIAFWIGFAALLGSGLLWAADFLWPAFGLLDDAQSNKIISFLTGGGVTGFVTSYAKKRLV
jgi:hypothetical protein